MLMLVIINGFMTAKVINNKKGEAIKAPDMSNCYQQETTMATVFFF